MQIQAQAETFALRLAAVQPQTLYRSVNLRNFRPPNWNDDEMADHVINHMTNHPHGTGGAGVWWTPNQKDAHPDTMMVHPDSRNFPVRLTTQWSGDPSHLDLHHGASGPTWEGWDDEKVFHPGAPLTLTSLQTHDEGDPLDPQPGQSPWKEHLQAPRQWRA
jgi:hypothetical protein